MVPSASGPSRLLGRYALLEEIGRGGMACVYKARFQGIEGFQRTVVVKAMRSSLLNNPEIAQMFRDEAILSAQLEHPNIVKVHDFGIEEGVPYLVMDFLDGWNLERVWTRQRASGRTIPVESAVFVGREIANAIAYAHEFRREDGRQCPIVHHDVTPSNIMLSRDGAVRLLDFGIAKVKGGLARTTGQVLRGKYGYLAPEQVNFGASDHRVDIFSLGIVLWEMLTGQHAFKASNDVETLDRISEGRVDPPSRFNPNVGRDLDEIVLRALARDPRDRFATAAELSEALTANLAGSSYSLSTHLGRLFSDNVDVAAPSPPPPPAPSRNRRPSREPRLTAPPSAKPAVTAPPKARTLAMSAAPPETRDWPAPPPAEVSEIIVVQMQAKAARRGPRTRWLAAIALIDLVAILAALAFCPDARAQALVARARPQLERAVAIARQYVGDLRAQPLFPIDYALPEHITRPTPGAISALPATKSPALRAAKRDPAKHAASHKARAKKKSRPHR
jgi:serine/threonine protein kinase